MILSTYNTHSHDSRGETILSTNQVAAPTNGPAAKPAIRGMLEVNFGPKAKFKFNALHSNLIAQDR